MDNELLVPLSGPEFIRGYYLTPSEHGLSDIGLRRLKVARFDHANDPFELMALNCHERSVRQQSRHFATSHNSTTGLLCFTSGWRNPVLWSHYAAKHQGICLGFDLRQSTVQPVEYADQRIRVGVARHATSGGIANVFKDQLVRTKSQDWWYEEELRVFVNLAEATKELELYFWPFTDGMRLAEVILGARCALSLSDVRTLTAATNPSAFVYKARLARRSFHIVPDGRTTKRPRSGKAA